MREYDETAVLAIVDELVTRGSSMHWLALEHMRRSTLFDVVYPLYSHNDILYGKSKI
jgi:hypothetical protein